MSSSTNTLVKRLVVSATLAGVIAGIALLLVARGGTTPQPAAQVRPWHKRPAAPVKLDQPSTSVWTGKELIVFGRRVVTALDSRGAPYVVKSIDVAEAYDPASQKWTRLRPADRPGLRTELQRRLDRQGRSRLRAVPLAGIQPRDEDLEDAAQVGRRRARRLDRPRGDRLGRRLLWGRLRQRPGLQPGDR